MKPERAAALLNGVVQTLGIWAEECREIAAECPRAVHLLSSLEQTRASLKHLIARETDP